MTTILQANGINKTFGSKGNQYEVLHDIDLQIEEGEYVGIMGPSGAGKSTLLNVLSTIDAPSEGLLHINGQHIKAMKEKELTHFRKTQLGFIFQDYNLLDTLTVKENILLPLSFSNVPAGEINRRIEEVITIFSLENIANKYPYEISGGQKQRTATARALIVNPSILFADEPTGALDSKSAYTLLQTLSQLNEERRATILMVTHDAYAASFCTRILFIKDGTIFTELRKGENTRKIMFQKILDILATMGGGHVDLV